MPAASFLEDRTVAVCPLCAARYASNDGWAWACYTCGPDAQMQSLIAVAQALADVTSPGPSRTCPHDGCLVLPGETCPACRVRGRARSKDERQRCYSDTEHDPKRPVSWRPNGKGIQVPVYEQSEVA